VHLVLKLDCIRIKKEFFHIFFTWKFDLGPHFSSLTKKYKGYASFSTITNQSWLIRIGTGFAGLIWSTLRHRSGSETNGVKNDPRVTYLLEKSMFDHWGLSFIHKTSKALPKKGVSFYCARLLFSSTIEGKKIESQGLQSFKSRL